VRDAALGKRANLGKRFESLLHWQCFVELCAVPPLAAALGLRRAYCREHGTLGNVSGAV